MKIAVFETEQWERGAFDELRDHHELAFSHEPLSADNAAEYRGVDIISPFIYSDLSKRVLTRLANLKLIATRSTGFDHIDTDYCTETGVTVCNVPTYGENTVAEHVFGLLLTISHNLVSAIDRTRRGDFSLQGLRGFDLWGKILGVIGTGNIGRCVIEIAKGFHMEVVAYDVARDEELAGRMGFRYMEMEELLSTSDVITLHVPANEKTHHLLSDDEFGKMKPGVVLINTSRGTVVDTQSLLRALAEGKVAATGLDVLPEEPTIREEAELLRSVFRKTHDLETLLADHILLRLHNVFITPHSAFNTREAIERILATTVENIGSFTERELRNVVVGESPG